MKYLTPRILALVLLAAVLAAGCSPAVPEQQSLSAPAGALIITVYRVPT